MRPTDVERADVYRGDELVAKLSRTPSGAKFQYLDSYQGPALATNLPNLGAPIITEGDNLMPFFANLLPEGARLTALVARARTSASDMFSLLMEAGPDCVGDVYAVPEGVVPESISSTSIRSIKDVDFDTALILAADEGFDGALAGVQDKLSISDSTITIPVKADAVGSAILKLSPITYPHLVENEAFFLQAAHRCGFNVNQARVVKDRNGKQGLLVSRFDRIRTNGKLVRLHQEDGCQLTNLYPADKYRISMSDMCKRLQMHASAPIPQILELIRRYAFAYLMGNADLHGKNISLYSPAGTHQFAQTPLYDVVCTALYPKLMTRMAMHINGKDDRFKVQDFVNFGARFEIPEVAIRASLTKLVTKFEPFIERVSELPYEERDIERTQKLMSERVGELKG